MTRTFVSVALAAAALLAATPAAAAPAQGYLVFVPHGDLDLTTSAGERALDRRLRAAAREACTETGPSLREWMQARECRMSFLDAGRLKLEQVWAARGSDAIAIAASR